MVGMGGDFLIAYFTAVGSPEDTTRLRNQILEARESIGTISCIRIPGEEMENKAV